jgi:alkyl sulfatase BDS1-like metallo-beta-lactamase superfamily hydrolase
MIATPHRLTLTALAALSLLATPFALAQQAAVTSVTSVTPAKDATAITRQDNLAVTNWDVGDGTKYGIELRNSVLIYTEGVTLANPDATLSMSKGDFARLLMGGQQQRSDAAKVSGNSQKVVELFSMLDRFDPMFNIVTP